MHSQTPAQIAATEAVNLVITALRAAGSTHEAIAAAVGLSSSTVRSRIAVLSPGLIIRWRNRLHDDPIIISMRAAGKTRGEIAAALGVSVSTVRSMLAPLVAGGRTPGLSSAPPQRRAGGVKPEVDLNGVIVSMRAAGEKWADIAEALDISRAGLDKRVTRMRASGRLPPVRPRRSGVKPPDVPHIVHTAAIPHATKKRRCLCGCGTDFVSHGAGNRFAPQHAVAEL